MPDPTIEFRFIEFVQARARRGTEAARVAVTQDGTEELLWMSIPDLRANMAEFGPHPELVKALAAYGITEADGDDNQIVDCPALHQRSPGYPFGDRVPKKVRMLKTVTADPMPVIGFAFSAGGAPPIALIGMELDVWTNSHGGVCAVFRDGGKLGLKPDEFEVIAWHTV